MFGQSGKVLQWFRPYLEQRSQRVHGILPDMRFLLSDVPQSSVLGPLVSQCIPVLLGSVRSDMWLNITCMLMTHSYIYHWFLTIS